MSLNYEELKQKNAPQKATTNDMIVKMEQASQVTIVESDYWKALINLNRNQNQMLNSILETKPDKETIAGESDWIVQQIKKKILEQENTIYTQLKNQETILAEQAGKMSASMLSEEKQMNNLLEKLKKMDSDILWSNDRNSSVLSNTLYFSGNLFKMIDNQTRYHRKRIKLSQKEMEKRLAHGQKSDGYEEYEDYTQTM